MGLKRKAYRDELAVLENVFQVSQGGKSCLPMSLMGNSVAKDPLLLDLIRSK